MLQSFDTVLDRCGLALAVLIRWEDLRKEGKFLDRLTFDQWVKVCQAALADSEPQTYALQKLMELATTFGHFLMVYDLAPAGSETKSQVLKRVESSLTVKDFDDRLRLYKVTPPDSDLRQLVGEKCAGLANDLRQWAEVYHAAPAGSTLQQQAFQAAKSIANK
ncbi:hypothetical protein HY933_01225 [Candidatus Falkowbacteria bacterium]|nr:hypothetical protein [Candidatus Falkowbacteria bacterium]